MKMEPDLIREILLYVEKEATRPSVEIEAIEIEDWTDAQVTYQVQLMHDAGFIAGRLHDLPDDVDPTVWHVGYTINRLTHLGHEFLESVRDGKVWNAVKENSKKAGVGTLKSLFDAAVTIGTAAVLKHLDM